MYSVVLWVVRLDDSWGYGHVIRTGNMFRLGIRPCFRHLWVTFVGRMLLRPYTCYMPYIEIRTCFPNGVYVSVGDTDMFFEPGIYSGWGYGNVFRTGYTSSIQIRTCFPNPAHVIHRNTNTFSEPDTRYPSKYGHVFATYGWRLWGVCNTPLHLLHVINQNTAMFFERGICFG